MTIKNNRFAILPHTCSRCERTFWLEPYKHYKIESRFDGYSDYCAVSDLVADLPSIKIGG